MKKLILAIGIVVFHVSSLFSQSYPAGFAQVQVVNGISNPTTFDFAPDGRIFVCQQDGNLRVIKNGVLLPKSAIDLDVDTNGERGLDGIVVHPDFANNHYVYLYFTVGSTGIKRNKLRRYTFVGDTIDPASETVILDLDPLSTANIHNSGCMRFSQDGKLFVSVGENNNSANAQNLDSYMGKILRINPDGSVPSDNPYANGATPQRQRVWAMGLRNPFTFDIDPVANKIFVNEVGHALWEEINDASSPGLNFGWPNDQGIVQNTTFTNPIFAYAHDNAALTGCAITGGGFFRPASTNYPTQYIGKYFFMDYCVDWIRVLDPNNPSSSTAFASDIPNNSLSMKTGPDGNLYFLSRTTGQLNKIIYTQNSDPIITTQPADLTIAKTQSASFNVSVSGAPPFTYQWKKNGSIISGATNATYSIPSASLTDGGNFSVVITSGSSSVTSRSAVLTVKDTNPPVAKINSPAAGAVYKAGDVIQFSGTGIDPEDGTLPAASFTWKIEFWHGTGQHLHVHDGPPIAAGVTSGSYTIPNNNETDVDVFYRLKLIVNDSQNIPDTASVDINPKLSTITIATNPAGFRVLLEGEPRNTSLSLQSVQGIQRMLGVITPQTVNGIAYKFDHWSNGGNATQVIATPESNTTYTAFFVEDTDLRNPENPSGAIAGLNYEYYEGSWLVLPDFATLTPTKTGTVPTFSLSPKNRDMNFAFRYSGYIDIQQEGVYKFYTSSNDGSKLYIGDRLVVNNDGQHGVVEASGTIGLKVGKHAISGAYFQYNGSSSLVVSYSAVGVSKKEIPAEKLFHTSGSPPANNPPTVSIVSPANSQQFSTGANVVISANASDSDGSITKVEFYQGGVKLGEDSSSPYQYTWNNVQNGSYSITVKAYDNLNSSTVSIAVNISVSTANAVCSSDGTILREYWTGITGQNVSNIPQNTTPSGTTLLNIFEGPQNWGDNYGDRIRGYVCAPVSGIYYFWISSNDAGELWLSTDDNPSNKVLIASITTFSNYRDWTKMASQKSAALNLVAGRKYYIEVLHKEGTNSDHISVGWQLPDGTLERPIGGNRLSPYGSQTPQNMPPEVSITSPSGGQQFTVGANITISTNASDSDGSINKVEFYQGQVKLGEAISSPYQFIWNNVSSGTYLLTAKAYDNNNVSTISAAVSIQVNGSTLECQASGTILREYWNGVKGSAVSNIPTYIAPTGSEQLNIFEGPQNWGDNYGDRIRGYVCPPATGNYYFWISSNDAGELWLSSDDNPDNKVLIASITTYTNYREWTKMASQKSAAINLVAGKKYYIEALHKEGVNSDHVSVGWQLPDGTLERPIAGSRLSPVDQGALKLAEGIELNSNTNVDSVYQIMAFPNPTDHGYITLSITGYKGKTKAEIKILDSNGTLIYENIAHCDITCTRTLINIDEKFTSGTYMIIVQIEGRLYNQKLIIR